MQVKDFTFDLPEQLIAQYPSPDRVSSRLLCLLGEQEVQHRLFKEIIDLIHPKDLLVLNNTRVMPARLYAFKPTGGKIEILIEKILNNDRDVVLNTQSKDKIVQPVLAHIKGSKSLKPGMSLILEPNKNQNIVSDSPNIKFIDRDPKTNLFKLEFESNQPILEILDRFGHIPLPPYMNRQDDQADKERYQTVYADKVGAIAAPTAGLHFDQALLKALQDKGVELAWVTLHVGAGTFQPIKVDNIVDHVMHSEWMQVSEKVCEQIRRAKERGGRVIAVGTTSVRCLETAAKSGILYPYQGETRLFINPGFQFQVVDGLLTNFHLPASTLLMLVCAFAGREAVLNAYQIAIENQYRFYSYGDAMFALKKES